MNITPSFSQRLKAGWSKEKLMKHYAISEQQYQKLIACLEGLKRIEDIAQKEKKRQVRGLKLQLHTGRCGHE